MKPIIQTLTFLIAIIALIILSSCDTFTDYSYDTGRIRDWQDRQDHDATIIDWNDNDAERIHDIIWPILNKTNTNWVSDGNKDVWKTAEEFEANGWRGDCEDHAIYFYMTLRRTGQINDSDLVIRTINDGGRGKYHTILIVYHSEGYCVIDNGRLYGPKDKYEKIECESNLFEIWR